MAIRDPSPRPKEQNNCRRTVTYITHYFRDRLISIGSTYLCEQDGFVRIFSLIYETHSRDGYLGIPHAFSSSDRHYSIGKIA
ncbi:hypothetical protein JTB14_013248 [Gonioctena quinquepunctata]|nr:hypothetical protein JTB14_013248 [Gonioctena quinquepunctata]